MIGPTIEIAGLVVLAAAPARPDYGNYYYLGLAALVVAMIWAAIWAYQSWEEAHEEIEPASKEELMDAFQQARLEGDLDDEEFARIRRRVDDEVRQQGFRADRDDE